MSQEQPPEEFDHTAHVRLLEEAERELRRGGDKNNHLAGAISRAIAFHHDYQTRIHSAHTVQNQMRRLADKFHALVRESESYVTKTDLPWISRAKNFVFDKVG